MRYIPKKLQFLWFFPHIFLLDCLEIVKRGSYMTCILIGEFMKFKPLHDRVLIEVLDSSEKTAGGIIIPDTAQEKPQEGKVIAVGGGAKTEDGKIIPMDVKVGDKVLFGKWSGTEVKIDGKEYSIMKESDIMGISSK
jgi:chaperonin GroES